MRSVFEIVILVCCLVGILSAARIATMLVRSRVVSALDMTKIGTSSFAITGITLLLYRPNGIFQFWIQSQVPVAIGIASAFLLAKYRDRAIESSLEDLLSRLMMRMKEGRSLSIALELVASESRSAIRLRWIEIARSVSFSPQKTTTTKSLASLRLAEIAREFQRIDALSRSQIPELERWRSRLRTDRTFRRRSVQAMAQTRAQSLILSIVFALLATFSVYSFGWAATRGPLSLSAPAFFLGLVFIWRGGRKIKWSV